MKEFSTSFGEARVRNVVVDINNNLEEGVDIYLHVLGEGFHYIGNELGLSEDTLGINDLEDIIEFELNI